MLTQQQVDHYNQNGFLVVSGLYTQAEVEHFRAHFESMRARESIGPSQSLSDTEFGENDPLLTYPRIMQPHRRDEDSFKWLTDARLNKCMTTLLGTEPFAVQTMFYFKPPGARGQALHQDQFYLRVQPGTCLAAWMAVDDCDEENGCLRVVKGSHDWPILCTVDADLGESFTDVTVPIPDDAEVMPIHMKAGDVLFFNGQLVHGSLPNTTVPNTPTARFRRALIGHYIVGEAEKVYKWYHPALRMDGTEVSLGKSEIGGTCGTWVDADGEEKMELQIEMVNEKIFGA